MFRCQCNTVVEKPVQTVVMVREKEYPFRAQAHPLPYKKVDGKRYNDDPGGNGYETVLELKSCQPCADKAIKAAKELKTIPEAFPANHRARRATLKTPQPEQEKNLDARQILWQLEREKRYMRE